jgi:hypothetical protein
MSRTKQRIEKLEQKTGKGLPEVRIVFSDEDEAAAFEEIGEIGTIIHVKFG